MVRTGPGQAQRVDDYEPSTGGAVYLRGLSRRQAEDQREDLAVDRRATPALTEPNGAGR